MDSNVQGSQEMCQVMTNTVQGKESLRELLRRQTLVFLRQAVRRFRRLTRPREQQMPSVTTSTTEDVISAGDLVRVRSLDEINLTLDYRGFTKGCKFMTQMAEYCEQEFRVAGSVEKFFDEARCRTLKCKNLFLLKGVHCNGESVGGCDRSCYLFWRGEWLKKIG